MPEAINIIVYSLGWILFVAAQAQNSIASKSNSLQGAAGLKTWLKAQAVNLATRAFFSGIAYGFIIHTIATKMTSVGFPISAVAIAGVGGYSANAMLYQFFGYFPFLRVEVPDLAPPPNSQVVLPATGTNSQPLPK
jgi:hypothetical protein